MKRRGKSTLSQQLKYANRMNREKTAERVQTWLHLPRGNKLVLPSRFHRDQHVRAADSLVEYCIKEYSQEGQVVFDPFAGYGTMLFIAEELGRIGYGIEYSKSKADYVQGLLKHPERLIHGDSRKLAEYDLPLIDLCLTSPPYTNASDTENPFVDYRQKGFDYPSYLQEMGNIFLQVARKMRPSARLVIEASNLKKDGQVTTLAWDIAREVSKTFHFEGETIFCWDEYGYGYNHSYCLVFSR
ncbi:MAG: DNA methylase [Chloroflexi bacterium]|nr:DNA methylase [Chloroflexota bacterium]